MATWNLSGNYAETCNCSVPCPCNFLGAPSGGECIAWAAWHIDNGRFDDTVLDNLNVAFALHAPGHMLETKWQVALYIDERADAAQTDAIHSIFGGAAGGMFGELRQFIGEVKGVRSAPIDFSMDGRRRSFRIGGVGEAEVEAMAGEGGREVSVVNVPLTLAPGQALTVAKGTTVNLDEHGMTLDTAGRNAFFSPFSYQSA